MKLPHFNMMNVGRGEKNGSKFGESCRAVRALSPPLQLISG
jgi:hypothetical protein